MFEGWSGTDWAAFLGGIALLVTSLGTIWNNRKINAVQVVAKQTHELVNSQSEVMKKLIAENAELRGNVQGRLEARSEADAIAAQGKVVDVVENGEVVAQVKAIEKETKI